MLPPIIWIAGENAKLVAKKERSDDPETDRFHRRSFFTEGFRQLLRPIAHIVEQRLAGLQFPEELTGGARSGSTGSPSGSTGSPSGSSGAGPAAWTRPSDPVRELLRPPGALPETEFLERCTGTGACVSACPVSAIRLIWSEDATKNGKPAIDPAAQACVVCDDLSCMKACPTGALRLVGREDIRMGLAELKPEICVRTNGEDCQICVDKCPFGATALEIPSEGAAVEVKDGCTGCGVCEMYCPTEPKAIVIELLKER
jgi:ferredoxin-type protein NapG